ncbi:AbrB family transcriptional regulator [Faunimonas sp. B44]|uniref:AbrB family transcriptional regulator n=1 Tax=Faunimonas sp. B44 TaxID=3461493 RepID=UPI0040447AB6
MLLALCVGSIGGIGFTLLHVPLAWMLGPMAACTIAAVARAPIAMPRFAMSPMLVVIGVLLGSGFNQKSLASVGEWALPLAGMAGLVIVSAALGTIYFRRIGGLDFPTAYFAAMPGGVIEMITLGEERGGDPRAIALIHSARVLLVVSAVPFLVQFTSDTTIPSVVRTSVSAIDVPLLDWVWLATIALAGAAFGHLARLPGKYLLGPVLVSAAFHLLGVTEVTPPFEIVLLAQLVLGISIGCRFAGASPLRILWTILLSVGATALLLSISVGLAVLLTFNSAFDLSALILAYAPGGLAEMSLVALSLQIEVAFVAFHHMVRVLLVLASSSVVFAITQRFRSDGVNCPRR